MSSSSVSVSSSLLLATNFVLNGSSGRFEFEFRGFPSENNNKNEEKMRTIFIDMIRRRGYVTMIAGRIEAKIRNREDLFDGIVVKSSCDFDENWKNGEKSRRNRGLRHRTTKNYGRRGGLMMSPVIVRFL